MARSSNNGSILPKYGFKTAEPCSTKLPSYRNSFHSVFKTQILRYQTESLVSWKIVPILKITFKFIKSCVKFLLRVRTYTILLVINLIKFIDEPHPFIVRQRFQYMVAKFY